MKAVDLIDATIRDSVQTSRILLIGLAKTLINPCPDNGGIFQNWSGFPPLNHEVNIMNARLHRHKPLPDNELPLNAEHPAEGSEILTATPRY